MNGFLGHDQHLELESEAIGISINLYQLLWGAEAFLKKQQQPCICFNIVFSISKRQFGIIGIIA